MKAFIKKAVLMAGIVCLNLTNLTYAARKKAAKKVVIKMGDNMPDRKNSNGRGGGGIKRRIQKGAPRSGV